MTDSNADDIVEVRMTREQARFLMLRSAGCFFAATEALLIAPVREGTVSELTQVRQAWGAINVATQDALK